MALCPNCHNDKPMFAPKCGSCNTAVGFLEQMFFQLVYLAVVLGGFYAIVMWLFG